MESTYKNYIKSSSSFDYEELWPFDEAVLLALVDAALLSILLGMKISSSSSLSSIHKKGCFTPPPACMCWPFFFHLSFNRRRKKTVLHIHNKPNVGYKRGITEFADGKLRKPCCSDLLDLKIAKEIDHLVQAIVDDSGRLYKRVFADYKLVQDRLYVHLPKGGDVKTITSNP
ncbi:hypothetical protein ZWY2020_040742 [Hordeum vulgare]|nr:hypothetical protein ZWY2020_040742 [Hordeum vulgare]